MHILTLNKNVNKIISYYYVLLEIILFSFLILEQYSFYFKGVLYHVFMVLFVLLNILLIVKYNDVLKFKKPFYISLIVYLIFLNNIYLFILIVILFFLILFLNTDVKFIYYTFLVTSLFACFLFPITFLRVLSVGIQGNSIRDDIYEDYHYDCGKYEIFYYSAGAMDGMHYAVVKKHVYVKIDNIIEIGYDKQISDSLKEYNKVYQNNKCKKIGN